MYTQGTNAIDLSPHEMSPTHVGVSRVWALAPNRNFCLCDIHDWPSLNLVFGVGSPEELINPCLAQISANHSLRCLLKSKHTVSRPYHPGGTRRRHDDIGSSGESSSVYVMTSRLWPLTRCSSGHHITPSEITPSASFSCDSVPVRHSWQL
jgi:hypothetical protein